MSQDQTDMILTYPGQTSPVPVSRSVCTIRPGSPWLWRHTLVNDETIYKEFTQARPAHRALQAGELEMTPSGPLDLTWKQAVNFRDLEESLMAQWFRNHFQSLSQPSCQPRSLEKTKQKPSYSEMEPCTLGIQSYNIWLLSTYAYKSLSYLIKHRGTCTLHYFRSKVIFYRHGSTYL